MAKAKKTKKPAKKEATIGINREEYTTIKTETGKTSVHNGDELSELLAPLSIEGVHKVASEILGFDTSDTYSHLNAGLQRMNVGNRLRGVINSEDEPYPTWNKLVKLANKQVKVEVKNKKAA